VFGTELATVPAHVPYLRADPARVAAWRTRLAGAAPRIGLVWSGNPTQRDDAARSMPLAHMLPLQTTGASLFALQPQVRAADRAVLAATPGIVDLGGALTDFDETAAVLEALDLVISVDTAVGHLAGALGRPTWLLLAAVPDWRWMLDREDSPWYPTARLFRQSARGDWKSVVRRVCEGLAAMARGGQ
jgi:ADP-heptose:LPS heptosyltransferase